MDGQLTAQAQGLGEVYRVIMDDSGVKLMRRGIWGMVVMWARGNGIGIWTLRVER
jgi:hypothetical protein